MKIESTEVESNLSSDEIELIMKALGFYQIHLLDQISKDSSVEADTGVKLVSSLIKKLHKLHEQTTGKPH
jgi:uncharacterized protein YlaN (UPF0358 family)